ncbi:CPBP family intramembrane metalloprotease [Kribbella sp. NBC_01505]|uniref:CPBP family intramembrane glutamic endopeptidase n=1 Tax=Kribbella sp. NBC_01505 TaxID=2903580 RepID=UPI00386A62B5
MGPTYQRLLKNEQSPAGYVVLGALAIWAGWAVVSILFISTARAIHADPEGTTSWVTLLANNLSLAAFIPLSFIVAQRLNRQTPGLLSSVLGRIRWRPLAWFAGAAVLVELLSLLAIRTLDIDLVGRGDRPAPDAAALIVVVLLTSTIQSAGEEYYYRGYLLQACGALMRNPVVAVLVTTVLFTMAHNVLPWQSPALFLDRFVFGLVAALLAIRTGGLEAGIAAHAANNIVAFVYAALTDSVSASLGAKDAPWSVVLIDIAKFVLFGAIALWIGRRTKLETESDLPLTPMPRLV